MRSCVVLGFPSSVVVGTSPQQLIHTSRLTNTLAGIAPFAESLSWTSSLIVRIAALPKVAPVGWLLVHVNLPAALKAELGLAHGDRARHVVTPSVPLDWPPALGMRTCLPHLAAFFHQETSRRIDCSVGAAVVRSVVDARETVHARWLVAVIAYDIGVDVILATEECAARFSFRVVLAVDALLETSSGFLVSLQVPVE